MRRANRAITIWLLRQPVWRYLLIYFVAWLGSSYIVSAAAAWMVERLNGTSGPKFGVSLTYHLVYAVALTFVSLLTRGYWRQKYARLLPPAAQQPEGRSSTPRW